MLEHDVKLDVVISLKKMYNKRKGANMRSIIAKTSYEGTHCWPEAPEEVAYLRNIHRHIFVVRATIEVFHDDREIEFIMVKHKIDTYLRQHFDECGVWQMGRTSCEQVAEDILTLLNGFQRQTRNISVSVFEDDENGCVVTNYGTNKL